MEVASAVRKSELLAGYYRPIPAAEQWLSQISLSAAEMPKQL
jgi:hypothetical protein